MEEIAWFLIFIALYLILFHEDYAWAQKIAIWCQKKKSGLQNWSLKKQGLKPVKNKSQKN